MFIFVFFMVSFLCIFVCLMFYAKAKSEVDDYGMEKGDDVFFFSMCVYFRFFFNYFVLSVFGVGCKGDK